MNVLHKSLIVVYIALSLVACGGNEGKGGSSNSNIDNNPTNPVEDPKSFSVPLIKVADIENISVNKKVEITLEGGYIKNVTKIIWDFADGKSEMVVGKGFKDRVTHTYVTPGDYSIEAQFYDEGDKLLGKSNTVINVKKVEDSETDTVNPNTDNNPTNPVEDPKSFSVPLIKVADIEDISVNKKVEITLEGGYIKNVTKIIWDFADGKSEMVVSKGFNDKVTHTYVTPGDYSIEAQFYDEGDKLLGKSNTVINVKKVEDSEIDTVKKLTATGITQCGDFDTQAIGEEATDGLSNSLDCSLNVNTNSNPIPDGQDGHIQAGEAMSYAILNQNSKECIKDQVTGLIWEKKTNDGGLQDKDNTYTWYNPVSSTNGGNAGKENGGKCKGSACDTKAYIATLNSEKYCGFDDWRMPTVEELLSIVDYGKNQPAINGIFSHTKSIFYVSATPSAEDTKKVWGVYFYHGKDGSYLNKTDSRAIRAVR